MDYMINEFLKAIPFYLTSAERNWVFLFSLFDTKTLSSCNHIMFFLLPTFSLLLPSCLWLWRRSLDTALEEKMNMCVASNFGWHLLYTRNTYTTNYTRFSHWYLFSCKERVCIGYGLFIRIQMRADEGDSICEYALCAKEVRSK